MEDQKTVLLTLGSYNITGSCFRSKKVGDFIPHDWSLFAKSIVNVLNKKDVDAIALQEVCADQAKYLIEMLPIKRFIFYQQSQTETLRAGTIFASKEEVEEIQGQNLGTTLIGIMYDPTKLELLKTGMFWYNEHPFNPPTAMDRMTTDKGFGNMNTPRALGWGLFRQYSSRKLFYFFTSHAPLSGNGPTRCKCFDLERKIIQQLVGKIDFFSVGDRNILPDECQQESFEILLSDKYGKVFDWKSETNHKGPDTTWIGYCYEPLEFQNQVLENGQFAKKHRLDVGYGSIKPCQSAHYVCLQTHVVTLNSTLSPSFNQRRNAASDHVFLESQFPMLCE